MLVKCEKCGVEFRPRSLLWAKNQRRIKCDTCYNKNKTPKMLKSLNVDTQNIIMSLEDRIDRVEEKANMIDVIVNTIIQDKMTEMESKLKKITEEIIENAHITINEHLDKEFEKRFEKLQKQIITLNNKIIKIEESK